MTEPMHSEVWAALACGTSDTTSTWLWCDSGLKEMPNLAEAMILRVYRAGFQVRYDPISRLMQVTSTRQIVPGFRLAAIGFVPLKWILSDSTGWIIDNQLRSGAYRGMKDFVHHV